MPLIGLMIKFIYVYTIKFEAKTLEQIARDLGATKAIDGSINWGNTAAEGTINLYTVYEPCHSCCGIIEQFNEAYPNITINVFWKS